MIVKIYDLARENNRLVGYIKVNEHDFTKVFVKGQEKAKDTPNEYFYRKFHKVLGRKWQDNYAWKKLSDGEVKEIITSYDRKISFYTKQHNALKTLSTI